MGRQVALGLGLAIVLPMLLSACVLRSSVPVIPETQAQLLMGPAPLTLQIFERVPGHPDQFQASAEPPLHLTVEGHHYLIPDPEAPDDPAKVMQLSLLSLDGQRVAVQGVQAGEAGYMAGTRDGQTLSVGPILCEDLKSLPQAAALIQFADQDCQPVTQPTDPVAFFQALVPAVPAITSQLRPVP